MKTKLEAIRERARRVEHVNLAIMPQTQASDDRAFLLRLVDALVKHKRDCPMIGECIPVCNLNTLWRETE